MAQIVLDDKQDAVDELGLSCQRLAIDMRFFSAPLPMYLGSFSVSFFRACRESMSAVDYSNLTSEAFQQPSRAEPCRSIH
jgi:hypothetical protein